MKRLFLNSIFIFSLFVPAQTNASQELIRGPYLQKLGKDQVTIKWKTKKAMQSYANLFDEQGKLIETIHSNKTQTDHEHTFTHLMENTQYIYSVGYPSPYSGEIKYSFLTDSSTRRDALIWVLGDSGGGTQVERRVAQAFTNFNRSYNKTKKLILLLGDNAQQDGSEKDYQGGFFDIFGSYLHSMCSFSTLGNHEHHFGFDYVYYNIFSFPTNGELGGIPSGTESYYSFDYNHDIHFISLDSTEGADTSPSGPMVTWLRNDLRATETEWKIVFWHHPPYSKGGHDSDEEEELINMRTRIVPIIEKYNVDLVLNGHSHGYERSLLIHGHYGDSKTFKPHHIVDSGVVSTQGEHIFKKNKEKGTLYVVAGSASLLDLNGKMNHPVMAKSIQVNGSLILDLSKNQIDGLFLSHKERILDHFVIIKNNGNYIDKNYPAVSKALKPLIMVEEKSNWSYYDKGPCSTSWNTLDDGVLLWKRGKAPFGYDLPVKTIVDPNRITTYYRHTFSLSENDKKSLTTLHLNIGYQDGVMVYINGQEVLRRFLPIGTITFTTLAGQHNAKGYESFNISKNLDLLNTGKNVIAVELHSRSKTPSPIGFDTQLIGEIE